MMFERDDTGAYGASDRSNCVVTPSPRKYSVTYATGSCSPQTVMSFARARLEAALSERFERARLPSVSSSGWTTDGIAASVNAPFNARYAARASAATSPTAELHQAPAGDANPFTTVLSVSAC